MKKLLILIFIAAIVTLYVMNCKVQGGEHPSSEHPKADVSTEEHPKAEDPKSEHPKAEESKDEGSKEEHPTSEQHNHEAEHPK